MADLPVYPSSGFLAEVLGRTLGSFAAIRGLEAQVDILEYREGGINDVVHRLPGAMSYPNLVLSNGLTSRAIEEWFGLTRLGAERHTMTVTFFDPARPSAPGHLQKPFPCAGPVRSSPPTRVRPRARSSRSPTAA